MREIKTKLGRLQSSLTWRYLGLTSTLLIGGSILFGVGQVRSAYKQQINNLSERVEDTANFLGTLTQESKLNLDDRTLARVINQTSLDQAIVYAIVTDSNKNVMGSFLNKKMPLISRMLQNDQKSEPGIVELTYIIKKQGKVREIRQPILIGNHKIGLIRLGYSVEQIYQDSLNRTEITLLASLCLGGVLIGIMAILFYQEVHIPIENLLKRTQELTQLDPALDMSSMDSLEQLAVLMETMGEQLQILEGQHQQLVNAPGTSEQQLQQESLAKSRFLAMVGHELRTPLNAVTGMTGLLLDTKLNTQQREFVDIIRGSGETLLTMINNILDFAKIEAKKLELEEFPFELGECIEEALRLFVPQASEKKLELAYLIEPHTPSAIVGDVNRLRQIVVNLLSNAVKFTETGEVVIYINATPVIDKSGDDSSPLYEIRFAVKDTGIGIPQDRMERLFQSFSQIDASTSRKYGGTGLGLVISKRLTEMMGGKMWVHSVEGKGTTFYFTVVAKAAPSLSPANSATAEEVLGGKRLLIVDDVLTNQKILTHQANSWGMLTCTVESGTKALEWLKQGWNFDVVILDMNMPQIDGLTLAQEIRKIPNCRRLPLVLLSSLGKPEMSEILEDVDFAAILTKPIQQSQLYDVLVRVLREQPIIVNHTLATSEIKLADSLPLRILVAEDVSVNQEVIRLQLEKLGYIPDMVSNGIEALQALRRKNYDVILMDIRMPEMDGMAATYHIRQEWTPDVCPQIIAMTADAMRGDREKCLESGMDDYIAKPVRLEDLRKALSKCHQGTSRAYGIEAKPPAIDRKVLDSLAQMAGSRASLLINELIHSYLEDAPSRLEMMESSISQNVTESLRLSSHALRSASLQLGATQLAHLCQDIETLARSGVILGASEKLQAIKAEYQRVCLALEYEMAQVQLPLTVNGNGNGNGNGKVSLVTINDNN